MRRQMRAALGAEFPGDGVVQILAGKLLRLAFAVAEALDRHQHEEIRTAAGDVLAFPAMALPLEHGIALGNVTHFTAIASTFQLHRSLQCLMGYFCWRPM